MARYYNEDMTSRKSTTTAGGRLRTINLADVDAGDNDRKHFDDAALAELAHSIDTVGLVQLPKLRPHPTKEGRFEIVMGERRIRALRLLGRQQVTVFVEDLDDVAAAEQMLVENLARVDLNPIEEAKAYRKQLDAGRTPEDVAKQLGRTAGSIRDRLTLLTLVTEAQDLVALGKLPAKTAMYLAPLDATRQRFVIRTWGDQGLPQAAVRALCQRLEMEQQQETMFDLDNFLQVEEYVAAAKSAAKEKPFVRLLELAEQMAAIVAGTDPDLAAAARAVAARCKTSM